MVLPMYKGKGDPMECGSYRRIKLLEYAMKVVKRIFEHRIRHQIEIDDVQLGFMTGKGTTDAIFMARQMQETFRVKGKKLYFGFVDLKKAFDRVPREVISWAMRKLGVEEWLVSAVMSMYSGAKTVARTVYGNSKSFEVTVGMHQGSALSPLLFVIVMEAISREFRVALPWELLYADDLAVIAETEEELEKGYSRDACTDFDAKYVKRRGSAQGSAFWGSRNQNLRFRPSFSPKPPFLGPISTGQIFFARKRL